MYLPLGLHRNPSASHSSISPALPLCPALPCPALPAPAHSISSHHWPSLERSSLPRYTPRLPYISSGTFHPASPLLPVPNSIL
ncbi:hypothetical protein P167DRAFT_144229 [Morchella conica CCBAS932]|uniref:Uncharacterized protein n=1 Tax=Morchella conica CCBAS932 TaxID=1392247 RepID=A0A3N4KWQ8_9PEZI|nr:hypothetical protein P167DRAFT_144229 [Morchella conica CCBAS932]